MRKTGYSDLPLHGGKAPRWLFNRMVKLSGLIIEIIVENEGTDGLLHKVSDVFWFQSFGCLLGFDWHSSGLTTTLTGAMKKSLKNMDIGITVCGGKGKTSLKTPDEIRRWADKTGINAEKYVNISRLTAKIDTVALQDGYSLYHHTFFIDKDGRWAVVQQGLNDKNGYARRYHYIYDDVKSFEEEPHKSVEGKKEKNVLNLVSRYSSDTRTVIKELITGYDYDKIVDFYIDILKMPQRHHIKKSDVNIKRFKNILRKVYNQDIDSVKTFSDILLLRNLGPSTMLSLNLISEIIFGKKPDYKDPARYSFAFGGKDGHPYPVNKKVYDDTISYLEDVVKRIKLSPYEKDKLLYKLKRMKIT